MKMSTDTQHTIHTTSTDTTTTEITSIAISAAKETLLWILQFFLFLGGVTAFSFAVALISSPTVGAVVAFLLILGAIVLSPNQNKIYFFPPQ